MDKVITGFLERNLFDVKDDIDVTITGNEQDRYCVTAENGKLYVKASNYISAFMGIYDYLKKYCGVQLSWCGNREIRIKELTMFDGEFSREIEQKFRVYMNYCTLDYSMCWWDFSRWEKEIDFMAMNGINMPLAVIGTEAVWYEVLRDYGFSEREALDWISGPAFWAWQLMTNIEGYMPPADKSYVYHRAELGKQILERYVEFGMQPIQQGFSGHVPMLFKTRFPNAKILEQRGWCRFPKTAQLDPTDSFFIEFGTAYLRKLEKVLGNYHYLACDPFHEGTPPKPWPWYLKAVGKTINRMYENFDKNSIWVMQSWSMRKPIVKAVPKNRLLVLDINSARTLSSRNLWGYPVVAGMLHNFGGKNSMQGKLKLHCNNKYLKLKDKGANVVGTGMFMEGIEQNPVIYDLQFELLTSSKQINYSQWLDDYIKRRYGKYSKTLRKAWDILLETCYCNDGYQENEVGSTLAARPELLPVRTGPCCYAKVWYDTKLFEKAVVLFASESDEYEDSDGYQYDLCDLVRQALSNRFYTNQIAYSEAYKKGDIIAVKTLAATQLDILADMDALLSKRSEFCLSRWIGDSHKLAADEQEKKYFDLNARTLVTLWGDIYGEDSLFDYSWREWSGLIKNYYFVRWQMFYDEALACLEQGRELNVFSTVDFDKRRHYIETPLGKRINEFEMRWVNTYEEYPYPNDSDVVPASKHLIKKWKIND
ncbi:MAG: alpha-N-acetylglucosaminidase [Eubacterium sp.]|nr:alpha-N-acetylglucosaminidase [Eubacterium sp.]